LAGTNTYLYVSNPLETVDASGLLHNAQWELRDCKGRIRTRGTAASGGTGFSRPNWTQQLVSHTERKILDGLSDIAKPGNIVTIRGTNPPCNPGGRGCQSAMQKFATDKDVRVIYSNGPNKWTYTP
jgi:hypothetical protein